MEVEELLEGVEKYLQHEGLLLKIEFAKYLDSTSTFDTNSIRIDTSRLKILLISRDRQKYAAEITVSDIYDMQLNFDADTNLRNTKNHFSQNLLWVKSLLQLASESDNKQTEHKQDQCMHLRFLYLSSSDISFEVMPNFSLEKIRSIQQNQQNIEDKAGLLLLISYDSFLELQIQLPKILKNHSISDIISEELSNLQGSSYLDFQFIPNNLSNAQQNFLTKLKKSS